MPLSPGSRLGVYQVTSLIGAGGMGEVYSAHDTTLGRDVAIKILPAVFANHADRLARFQREAQLLASLNHPNVASIYGLELAEGIPALVMELVPGQTLAERIAASPIPVDEVVALAQQIAEAMAFAHEKGIVHRDLKPANIKITPEGKVKVLDFGLAKAMAGDQPGASPADASQSATMTVAADATRAGAIFGTAAYMSPEQARGKPVDRRADIWAFGSVLYEMLTGRPAFGGETVTDMLSAVISREPDWGLLPAATPGNVRRLLRRCLAKDPRRRLHSMADASLELEDAEIPPLPAPAAPAPSGRLAWFVAVCALAVAAACVALVLLRPRAAAPQVSRLTVPLADADELNLDQPLLLLTHDGKALIYAARRGNVTALFLRPLNNYTASMIPGTEGALMPFLSPDGDWVAFFADGKIKKTRVSGGAPVTVCDAVSPRGGAWSGDTIVFAPTPQSNLFQVSAGGGKPQPLTTIDAKLENTHRWPHAVPGGHVVLFTAAFRGSYSVTRVLAADLQTGQTRLVLDNAHDARVLPSGRMVFMRGGALLSVPFDVSALRVTGPPVAVAQDVYWEVNSGYSQYDISQSGSLAYIAGGPDRRALMLVDRDGAARQLDPDRRSFRDVRYSPDGRRLAVSFGVPNSDVWIYDIARGAPARMTFEGNNQFPTWSADGKRVIYSTSKNRMSLMWKTANGLGVEEVLLGGGTRFWVRPSWSPDGLTAAIQENQPMTGDDIAPEDGFAAGRDSPGSDTGGRRRSGSLARRALVPLFRHRERAG